MKLQRRELNVFSMSALDLFASGMGAFVLLALISLPFFPNTGDAEKRVETLAAELSEVQEALETAEAERDAEAQKAAEAVDAQKDAETKVDFIIPHLDIVICLDVTGSMTYQIEGLKREIASLSEVLDRVAPSVGIGLVAFGDRRWRRTIHEMDIVETTNMSTIHAFVNNLTPGMRDPDSHQNSDGPEAVTTALEHALVQTWRSNSEKRYIIVITDNAAYPNRISEAFRAAREFSSQNNHYVSAVRANLVSDDALQFLEQLAEEGQGNFVDAAGGESMISSILLAVLET